MAKPSLFFHWQLFYDGSCIDNILSRQTNKYSWNYNCKVPISFPIHLHNLKTIKWNTENFILYCALQDFPLKIKALHVPLHLQGHCPLEKKKPNPVQQNNNYPNIKHQKMRSLLSYLTFALTFWLCFVLSSDSNTCLFSLDLFLHLHLKFEFTQ